MKGVTSMFRNSLHIFVLVFVAVGIGKDNRNAVTAESEVFTEAELDNNVKLITEPLAELRKTGFQKFMIAKKTANQKLKDKFKKVNTAFNENKFIQKLDDDQKEAAVGAIGSVVSGAGTLIGGIRNSDTMEIVSGTLGIASAIISLAGPVGSIISTVLSLVSTIFSLFGGSSEPAKKEEEPSMKSVLEKAIEEGKLEALEHEIAGVKALYATVATSVSEYRKSIENEQYISMQQGLLLYDHAFKELVSFGILREIINKYCGSGMRSGDAKTMDLNAERCGVFVRLYCSLSVQRTFLLIDIAAVLSTVKNLTQTNKNILALLERQQENDHDFLKFLFDPINYPDRRYAVSKFFDAPQDNGLTMLYLKHLHKLFPHFSGFYKPPVVGCAEPKLQGSCVAFYSGKPLQSKLLKGSIYVPFGNRVSSIAYANTDKNVTLLGASTYTITRGVVHQKKITLTYQSSEIDASDQVRVCGKTTGKNQESCRIFERSQEGNEVEHDFVKNIVVETVFIPNGLSIELLKENDETIAEFDGPNFIKEICNPESWTKASKIKVKKNENVRSLRVCDAPDLGGKCVNVKVPNQVEHNPIFDIKDRSENSGCKIIQIKSMKIPEGLEVTMMEYAKYVPVLKKEGPFTGPITVNLWSNTNFTVLKLYDYTLSPLVFCDKPDQEGNCYQISLTEQKYYGGDRTSKWPVPQESIRVPYGIKIELYARKQFEGKKKIVVGPNLSYNFNFHSYDIIRNIDHSKRQNMEKGDVEQNQEKILEVQKK